MSVSDTLPHPTTEVIIEPRPGWHLVDLREVWRYRELMLFMVWRDVKVKYKQTVLGFLWALIEPLCTLLIFTVIFGKLGGLGNSTGGIPYPIFVCAGLLPWNFFSKAVTGASNSLVASAGVITKVYFPRLIVPMAAVGAQALDFLVSFAIIVALMFHYNYPPSLVVFALVPLTLLLGVTSLGVGAFLSVMTAAYRDFRPLNAFMIRLWMFVTPVIYPTKAVPENWQWVLALNPMTGVVDGFRSALLNQPFDWPNLGISTASATVMLFVGLVCFRRIEGQFADIV